MAWKPSEKEVASVSGLGAAERYAYLIKKAADEQRLWSLSQGDVWVLAGDESGNELVPVWPHEHYASACANGAWSGCTPRAIGLDVWMERWIPGIAKDGRLVAVFPTSSDKGVAVAPRIFAADLSEELSKY